MDARKRTRLIRILGLLGSDNAGERAAAADAAHRLVQDAKTDWAELLQSAAKPPARASYGVDERGAAEARMRQLRSNNERLEKQVRALRRRLAIKADVERRRREASELEN